jgi:hypothetical protein
MHRPCAWRRVHRGEQHRFTIYPPTGERAT